MTWYPPKKKEEPEPVSHFCDVVKLSTIHKKIYQIWL
jgi:hypothetical protein